VVKVTVDAERFDFRLTGAAIVIAPQGNETQLKHNPSLRVVRSSRGWSWFDIINSN
jgi:hypothetical protein